MTKQKREFREPSRAPLAPSSRDFVFQYLIRDAAFFNSVRYQITPEVFGDSEGWLALIWRTVCNYFRECNSLPSKDLLIARLNSELDVDDSLLSDDDDMDNINTLISIAFELELSPELYRQAVAWLRQFLEDKLLIKVRSSLSLPIVPKDLVKSLESAVQAAETIRGVEDGRVPPVFGPGWNLQYSPELMTTGVPVMDAMVGGGHVRGEVYGLLGPTGGGKSTTATHMAISLADSTYKKWIEDGQPEECGKVYLFSYEDPMGDIYPRILACSAQIPRSRQAELGDLSDLSRLSRCGHYAEYESSLFRDDFDTGSMPAGERERLERTSRVIDKCLAISIMNGSDMRNPDKGAGLIDEIAEIITKDIIATKIKPEAVFIDFALAAVDRYISAHAVRADEQRTLLTKFPQQARTKIATKFDCPVWVLHQLNTKFNEKEAGFLPKSTDAAESKAFPMYCNFVLMLGKCNKEGYTTISCGKHRRTGDIAPRVIRVNGNMSTIDDAGGLYVLDTFSNNIISVNDQHSIAGGPPPVAVPAARTRRPSAAISADNRNLF